MFGLVLDGDGKRSWQGYKGVEDLGNTAKKKKTKKKGFLSPTPPFLLKKKKIKKKIYISNKYYC